MSHRLRAVLVTVALVMPAPLWAQSGTDIASLRTSGDQPDISGVFTFRTLTPLQRPEALGDKAVLTVEEAAQIEASGRVSNSSIVLRARVKSSPTTISGSIWEPMSWGPDARR